MAIYKDVSELVGNTPLVELSRFTAARGVRARLLGKVEALNPAGSIKDRVARAMLDAAWNDGLLGPESVIIEPTSGNTGIGLCSLAAARGLRCVIVMPDTMSVERRNLMAAYGAEVVLTEGAQGMAGAIQKAEDLAREIPHAFIPSQFTNPANPAAHFATTGPEIWEATEGTVDVLVAGIGTGGTVSGTGTYLKTQNPAVHVVGVEPAGSPVLTEGRAGAHGLQGMGAGFVPDTLDVSVCDEVLALGEEEAYAAARDLATCEGLLVGISSGAALAAAVRVAQRPENEGKLMVVILPDSGERYLTTDLFRFC